MMMRVQLSLIVVVLFALLKVSSGSPPSSNVRTLNTRKKRRRNLNLKQEDYHGRYLEDQQNSKSNDSNDSNDNNNNNQDNDESGGNIFTKAWSRIADDMGNMWNSSPSSWVAEYWEVFAAIASIAFFLFCCHCFMAYDICCLDGGNPTGRKVMTAEELKQAQQEQSYVPPSTSVVPSTPKTPATESSTKSYPTTPTRVLDHLEAQRSYPATPSRTVDHSDAQSASTTPSKSDLIGSAARKTFAARVENLETASAKISERISRRRKRRERNEENPSMFEEVVSVWSEFLGLSKDEKLETDYRPYHDTQGDRSGEPHAKRGRKSRRSNEVV